MKKIVVLIFTFICLSTIAQPAIDNDKAHRRYWYYRARFINDFVKIGGEQGDCIALPERNYLWGASNSAKVGPDQIDIMNQYLSALALEYKILTRNSQSTKETIKEIFYILKMYNRLDIEADAFWAQNQPTNDHLAIFNIANLNGFMLREDMPHDYFDTINVSSGYKTTSVNNYLHFNYAKKEYNSTASSANLSFTGLEEINKLTTDNKFSNSEVFGSGTNFGQVKKDLPCVMDKYLSMFNAFMLLIKYIPDNTAYYENNQIQLFQDNESDIKQEIRNITNHCHPYIRGNTFGGNGSNWVLEYPDGNTLDVGAFAIPYSYPLAKMVCYINSGYPWGWPCNAYQDGNSLTLGFTLYNALYLNPIPSITPTLGSEDAAVFLGNVMAGSNAPVYTPTWPPIPIPAAIAMDLNTSLNNIEWADLLRRVHHQSGVLMKQKSVFANPINLAPCKGPYNYGGGNDPGFEWRSQDRLEHPKSRITNTPPPGNYPGVDYMLLHNLYYEYLNQLDDNNNSQTGKYKNAYNLMDNYDEKIWPQTIVINQALNITFGVNQSDAQHSPMPIKLFQNLTSRAQIYGTTSPLAPLNTISSKVIYRAGKDITLLPEDSVTGHPGFEVKAGSDFTAYIERYICGSSDYENGMRQNQNANTTAYSNDYEIDTMNVDIPIHYVEYPKSDSDLNPQNSEEEPVENFASIEQQQILLQEQLIEKQLADQGIYNTNKTLIQRFLITPNPNNGVFMIYVNKVSDDEFFSISIIDMKGSEVKRLPDVNTNLEVQINLTEFSKGIYMVKLFSNKGFNALKKISVN